MGLLGPVVGRLYDRVGPTRLLVPGAIIVAAVMWALTLVDQHTSIAALLTGHIAICVGLALMFTPLFTASLSSVPTHLYSHGTRGARLDPAGGGRGGRGAVRGADVAADGVAGCRRHAAGRGPRRAASALAFLCGAVLSLAAIAAAFFVRGRRCSWAACPATRPASH